MSRVSSFAMLTGALECDGCFLTTGAEGLVHISAHAGDEAALERWDVAATRSYIDRHRQQLWIWLRTPTSSLPQADRYALHATLGQFVWTEAP